MIFICAGHHMDNKGCSINDFNEHDEAGIWSSLIANAIRSRCMVVPGGTLAQKTTFINSWASADDIAIEIHFNERGCASLYNPDSSRSKDAAQALQTALSLHFATDNDAMEGWYRGYAANGIDWFLKNTECVSVIIEPDHINHRDIIQSRRADACQSIADTLMRIDND